MPTETETETETEPLTLSDGRNEVHWLVWALPRIRRHVRGGGGGICEHGPSRRGRG
jgi:hypothetical protein